MFTISTIYGPLSVKFGTVKELVNAVNAEKKSYENAFSYIAIDGTPTTDDSLFGSRQKIMEHLTGTIEAYFSHYGEENSIEKFYNDNLVARDFRVIHKSSYRDNFETALQKYDEYYEKLKELIANYKAKYTPGEVSEETFKAGKVSVEQYADFGQIQILCNSLYDLLILAKEFSNTIYDNVKMMVCQNILLKYIEVGSDIYNDASLFQYPEGESYEELSKEISKRHKPLKALAHRNNPFEMEP